MFRSRHGFSGGVSKTINTHIVKINALSYTPTDEGLIPTGVIAPVSGTPLDFTRPAEIGARVNEPFADLLNGKGYDHNWILNKHGDKITEAAVVTEPESGIRMRVITDQPALQFYGGNFLNGTEKGKYGEVYTHRTSFAMIVFCGGFSNSDVLGSAKGWAGGFLFNEKAKLALDNFYKRNDTLSLGICNGCQLMVELFGSAPQPPKGGESEATKVGMFGGVKMLHNDSHKFESGFVSLTIPENNSVMLGSLSGSKLGVWVAHGEGKFYLPKAESEYNIIAKYSYADYPANPNGSDYSVAGICSNDGRHLAMMPHPERAIFPCSLRCELHLMFVSLFRGLFPRHCSVLFLHSPYLLRVRCAAGA